jgi:DNA-binding PadR family transcriptional regulator
MKNVSLDLSLSQQEFYALLALTERPRIGYDIGTRIAADSESRIIVASGTLYPLLSRLTKAGLIERDDRWYSLTDQGRRRLIDEARRLEHVVVDARRKLGLAVNR